MGAPYLGREYRLLSAAPSVMAAIENRGDMKTAQGDLGHAAAFTLSICAHTTQKMCQQTAGRTERFIQSVSGTKRQ